MSSKAELIKARTIFGFILENLEHLRGYKSIDLMRKNFRSLCVDLTYIKNFIQLIQEHQNHMPMLSDLVTDIIREVGKLLDSTDVYVQYKLKSVNSIKVDFLVRYKSSLDQVMEINSYIKIAIAEFCFLELLSQVLPMINYRYFVDKQLNSESGRSVQRFHAKLSFLGQLIHCNAGILPDELVIRVDMHLNFLGSFFNGMQEDPNHPLHLTHSWKTIWRHLDCLESILERRYNFRHSRFLGRSQAKIMIRLLDTAEEYFHNSMEISRVRLDAASQEAKTQLSGEEYVENHEVMTMVQIILANVLKIFENYLRGATVRMSYQMVAIQRHLESLLSFIMQEDPDHGSSYLLDEKLQTVQRDHEFLRSFIERGMFPDSPTPFSCDDILKIVCRVLQFLRSFIKGMQLNTNDCLAFSHLPDEIMIIVCRHLKFLRSFFTGMKEKSYLKNEIGELLDGIKEYVDSSMVKIKDILCSSEIPYLVQRIKSVEPDISHVLNDAAPDESYCTSADCLSIRLDSISIAEENVVIGMEDETTELQNRLIGGWKQLEMIPVVGMAGIGKTTLVRKLYNDQSIGFHFHIRAWGSVSQSYQKTKLLRHILSSIVGDKDPILSCSEADIEEKLYKSLKGRRYLIVLDDVWEATVWNDLQSYLPDDSNSSRVLMTSRNIDVLPNKKPPHFLRFMTEEESWDLFKSKVFGGKSCSEELIEVGKEMVATCKGLPIAIVVIGGILAKKEKTLEKWTELAKTIRSKQSGDSDFDYIMDILASSYNNLPFPLKSCFLYLGSFPEDHEFPAKWLVRAWIAQGFIVQDTSEIKLEDIAEGYIMDLIDRSLLIVAKRKADGRIKSCQIHDLLRDLCIKKADEKNFLQAICRCGSMARSHPSFSDCQYFHFYDSHFVWEASLTDTGSWSALKFITTLDIRRVIFDRFPEKIFELLHLKFLALQVGRIEYLPSSIFELWNLETFILEGEKGGTVELVPSIKKMKRLRHFHVTQALFVDPKRSSEFRRTDALYNLQTISIVSASDSLDHLLLGTPNLRKLGLYAGVSSTDDETIQFPSLSYLSVLESLKFEYQTFGMKPFIIPDLLDLPQSLKKLTLIGSCVDWSRMSILGRIPNLEVLKLKDNFFSGPKWETSDDGFPGLKYLKLSHMDLKEWVCSSSHFPKLEQLVLNGCLDLVEIPPDIGEIPTLQTIKVYKSSESVVEWAKDIQVCSDDLKVFIFNHFLEY